MPLPSLLIHCTSASRQARWSSRLPPQGRTGQGARQPATKAIITEQHGKPQGVAGAHGKLIDTRQAVSGP